MTEHDSNHLGDGGAVRRISADAQDLERTIVAVPDLAESFREAMELLAKEARELGEIVGPPVVDAPLARRSSTPAGQRRTFTIVATTIAASGLVLVLGGFAYVGFDPQPPALAEAAAPLALLPSSHPDALIMSRLSPPHVTPEPPRLMPVLPAAPATAPAPVFPAATPPPAAAPPAAASRTSPLPSPVLPPTLPSTAIGTAPPAPASGRAVAPAPSTPAPMTSVVAPTIRAEVIDAHTRWFAAYARGDKTTLGALEADGFRILDMRPPADRVSRHPAATRRVDRVTVEVSGDAVVFAARMTEEIRAAGDERTVISDLSEVWSPSGAGWRLLGTVIRPAAQP